MYCTIQSTPLPPYLRPRDFTLHVLNYRSIEPLLNNATSHEPRNSPHLTSRPDRKRGPRKKVTLGSLARSLAGWLAGWLQGIDTNNDHHPDYGSLCNGCCVGHVCNTFGMVFVPTPTLTPTPPPTPTLTPSSNR